MSDLAGSGAGAAWSVGRLAQTQLLVLQSASAQLLEGRAAAAACEGALASVYSAAFGLVAEWGRHPPGNGTDGPSTACWRVYAGRPVPRGETVECCDLLDPGPLSGLAPGDESALAKACLWLRRRGRPASAVLPMGFGALYRRAPAGGRAAVHARWAKGGRQLLLTAAEDIAVGEEVTLPGELAAMLREQEGAEEASSDASGAEDAGATTQALVEAEEEGQEDWDAIEAALQEASDDEEPAEEADASPPACLATAEWYRECARRQLAEQEARALQPVWSLETPPATVRLLAPGTGVTAGAVRAGRSRVHGLGVFALTDFASGSLVEICPALLLDKVGRVALADYAMAFEAPADGSISKDGLPVRSSIVALGCGALYNHRETPNVAWCHLGGVAEGVVAMTALRRISVGEELFISYGTGYWRGRSAPELANACQRMSLTG